MWNPYYSYKIHSEVKNVRNTDVSAEDMRIQIRPKMYPGNAFKFCSDQKKKKPTAFNSTGKIVQKVVQESTGAIWFLVQTHEILCKWISCGDNNQN